MLSQANQSLMFMTSKANEGVNKIV